MARFVVIAVALCATGHAAASFLPSSSDLSLAELVARNTEARGGRKAIEAVKNLEVRLRIEEPTYTAEGIWRVDRSGRMRIDVSIDGKRVFTEGFDGERGWQLPGGEEHGRPASSAAAAALRHSAQLPTNILGLQEMAGHGHRLEAAGRKEVAGVRFFVLLLTLDDGFETQYWLDPATFLIARARVRKALHPDRDPTPTTIESVWSDFREVAGVKFPFRETQTDLETGKLLQTSTILDVSVNRPDDANLFRMP